MVSQIILKDASVYQTSYFQAEEQIFRYPDVVRLIQILHIPLHKNTRNSFNLTCKSLEILIETLGKELICILYHLSHSPKAPDTHIALNLTNKFLENTMAILGIGLIPITSVPSHKGP